MLDSFTRVRPVVGQSPGLISLLQRAARRRRRLALVLLVVLTAFPVPGPAGSLPEPFWSIDPVISSDDGYADLHWAIQGREPVEFFRLTERFRGRSAVHFVDHPTTRLYRNQPGLYEFWVQACERDGGGYPSCGTMSPRLQLTVTDEVQKANTGKPADSRQPPVPIRSPSGFAPGRWHNPDRPGHGWSFFWKSRLSLHPSNPQYGEAWDLLGVWYTYEARVKYEAVSGTCPGPNCTWVYDDYRPIYARMWLTKVNSQQYHGSVSITRSNIQTNVGSVLVTFGPDNASAELAWGASFHWQYLSGSDDIQLLVAPDADPVDNPAHYSGLWELPPDGEYLVAHSLGWISESVEVMFEDEDGQPAWIMAAADKPIAGHTDLCFFYVAEGFAPGTTADLQFYEQGCDVDAPAGPDNRNGSRQFPDFEREDFWVDIDLPGGTAPNGFTAGAFNTPDTLHKHASFHRIEYASDSGSSCQLSAGSPECSVSLTWFSDGDFPGTSAFAHRLGGAEPLLVSTDSVMEELEWCIDEPGEWQFELRMGDTANSSLMGISESFNVSGTGTSACAGGGGAGGGTPETPPLPASAPGMTPTLASSRTGATAGEFSVSPVGAANYKIPIAVAPGSGGTAPSVALVYDSQSGNGPVGVGWAIDGFSVISRCAQTIEQDAATRPGRISFTNEDRFCLDGERLMAVNGSYGAHGTEYRKERDDFTRVISYGSGGNGPQYFKAWSREGILFEFGLTTDSRIETRVAGIANVAFAWAQNRAQDTAGNYMDYRYSEQIQGAVDFVLDNILYTGNSNAGTSPYAEMRFVYAGGRSDAQPVYTAGVAVGHARLLQRIDSLSRTTAGAPLQFLRSYQLDYGVDGWGRAVLESLTECRDASASVCFQPSTFDWQKSEHRISSSGPDASSLFTADFRGLALGDSNGDGLSDLLITERDGTNFEFAVATGSAAGGFTLGSERFALPHGEEPEAPVALTVIDLNADGYQDVLYIRKISTIFRWYARLAGPSGMGNEFVVIDNCCGTLSPPLLQVMDFDGDGLSDIMTSRPTSTFEEASEIVVLINDFEPADSLPAFRAPLVVDIRYPELFPSNTETGWELADEAPIIGFQTGRPMPGRVDDFYGDGAVDILVRLSRLYRKCGQPPCAPLAPDEGPAPAGPVFIFEGEDGATRAPYPQPGPLEQWAYATFYVAFFADENGAYSAYDILAKGTPDDCGVPDICNIYPALPEARRTQPVDVNADGLADVAYLDKDFGWYYRLNTGAGFLPPQLIGRPPSDERAELARFIDITGDGYVEFLYPHVLESDSALWMVQYNDLGNGFSSALLSTMPAGHNLQGDTSVMLDFTGDGIIDQLFIDWRADGNGARQGSTRLRQGINSLTGKIGAAGNVVLGFEDGFGQRADVRYRPLTGPDVHSRMNDSAAAMWGRGSAVYDLSVPFFVVSAVETSAPGFGNPWAKATRLYHYVGAKIQAGGRGFLGFAEVIEYDPQNGLRTNIRYRQDFPFSGLVADSRIYFSKYADKFDSTSDISELQSSSWGVLSATTPIPASDASGILLRNTIHEWKAVQSGFGSGAWAVRLRAELAREFALEGQFKRKTFTTRTFDAFGNITKGEERHYALDDSNTWSTTTTGNGWINDTSRWRLGRLASTEVRQWRSGAGSEITRRASYAYDPASSLLTQETAEPGHSTLQVMTTYGLDAFGNRIQTTVRGAGMTPRTSSSGFDGWGRFAVESRNVYNQVTHRILNWDVFGNALQTANIDGVMSWAAADHMGRVFASYSETGSSARTDLGAGGYAQCPAGTAFHSIATGGGQPRAIECFDALGRVTRKATESFAGSWVYVDSYFDVSGRPERVSEPYFAGSGRHWNSTLYDALGRVRQTTAANGLVEQVFYDRQASHCGRKSVRAVLSRTLPGDGTARERWELQNVAGEAVEVIDDACAGITYGYDAVGNLVEVMNIDGSVIAIAYDELGLHKVQMTDPDKGTWQYASNALGEVTRQLDSKQQAIDFQYDEMGRVVHRRERTGVSSLQDTSFQTRNHEIRNWQNSAAPGVTGRGQISLERYVAGEAGAVLHERSYAYDGFGRVEEIDHLLQGNSFTESVTYDQFGRVFQRFDASGNDHGARYHYNSRGYLHKIQEARQGESGAVYQQVLALDPRGNPTAMVLGNETEVFADYDPASGFVRTLEAYSASGAEMQRVDYSFDRLGNLERRHDSSGSSNLREDFEYDALSRLERVFLTAPALGLNQRVTQSMSYDASGNITHKSGVGSYTYGQGIAGPHAITGAGAVTYTYDANGNQVGASNGRSIDYTVFDKPTRIQKGTHFTEFTYGLAHQRYKRADSNQVDAQKTTWTIGGVEFIEEAGSAPYFKRYIGGVAVVDYHPSADDSVVWYLANDHLGSVHTISNADGEKVHENHFDAWGIRQATDWQSQLTTGAAATANGFTTRGFTGHEHADGLGIIHMNGRIYDPRLGRFLQADPFVQAPMNGQSLNRYTYALNNPLSYTDPSGYFLKRLIRKWGRVIVAAVASYFTFGAAYGAAATAIATGVSQSMVFAQFIGTVGWQVVAGAAAGAASGLVAGAILTGSLRGAVKSAFVGAVTYGLNKYYGHQYNWQRVAAESIAGGVNARVLGGKFDDGLRFALTVSSLNYANYRMDLSQRARSANNPLNLNKPGSGLFGHDYSLAGARRATLPSTGELLPCKSLAGGCQGLPIIPGDQPSALFGILYDPRGPTGYLTDSFAGPHDWFRDHISRSYDELGNSRYFVGLRRVVDTMANFALIPVAAPFAVATITVTQPVVNTNLSWWLHRDE